MRASVTEGDEASNVEALLAEGKLAVTLGHLAKAHAANEAALASSRAAGDLAGTARALGALATVEAHRGHLTAADELFNEAAQAAARAADPMLEQAALQSGWVVAYQSRAVERSRSLAASALELAIKLGDRTAEAKAHDHLGITFANGITHAADAREHFDVAARIYGESGNLTGIAAQLLNRAVLEAQLGFFDRALAATEEAVAAFEQARDAQGRIVGLSNIVFLRASKGEIGEARHAAEKALKLVRQFGWENGEPFVLENLASAEAAGGDYARAIELAERSFEIRRRSASHVWSGKTLADVAVWYARLGNLPAAQDAVRRLLAGDDSIARFSDQPTYCYWAAAQVFTSKGVTPRRNGRSRARDA